MEWTFWQHDDEERAIRFAPAFHRCRDERGNFGIGGVRMMWMLRVGGYGIGWDVHTGWLLPKEEFMAAANGCDHPMHRDGPPRSEATGGAVDFHMPQPMWEGHEPTSHECQFTGGVCYSDVGFLLGNHMFDLLRTKGDDAVWSELRALIQERIDADAKIAPS